MQSMTAQLVRDFLVSPEDYLEGELHTEVKHEYLAGVVHAMAGARNVHNDISGNVFLSLGIQLRGKPCRPCNSDTKVRLRLPTGLRFYYPDAQVTCQPNPPTDSYQDQPIVVVEVCIVASYAIPGTSCAWGCLRKSGIIAGRVFWR